MVNFQIQYHQQRKNDQEITVYNLEALKNKLLSHMQQQYNDFNNHLDQQWAALDIKFMKALQQQRKDLVMEFTSQINPLITEFNKILVAVVVADLPLVDDNLLHQETPLHLRKSQKSLSVSIYQLLTDNRTK
ncbi:hypothetical protein BDZ91DRAFT_804461 [Kalaharituber pfeilii]|nr:hypothetical protein BDZ91DRAFT_804461 [Kalaharituber pfeilii]